MLDRFRQLLSNALSSLRDLSLSQRLAILLSGMMVAVSIVWLTNWAATPEMTPLLPQPLEGAELASISEGLDRMGEPYRIEGSQVLVGATANRSSILARLQQDDRLPASTSVGFDALVRESNPWLSQEENDRRWTVALKRELEGVLNRFEGVKHAEVFLNLTNRPRGFARTEAAASAGVTLIMKPGEALTRERAVAAAKLVSGAVRGLSLRNVQVVDGSGQHALEWDDEAGSGLTRLQHEHERRIAEKIRSQLAFDPRVRVNVQVDLELTSSDTRSATPTSPVEVRREVDSSKREKGARGGQPGVEPNTGVAVGGAGGSTIETRETENTQSVPGEEVTLKRTPSGGIKAVFAAVNVSYTYLAAVHRRQNPNADPPTEEQIASVFQKERERIVSQVAMLVKAPPEGRSEDQVRVDWYYDTAVSEPEPVKSGALDTGMELAQRFGPQAGLALLALFSLGLMLRMSRRSAGSDAGESFGMELGLPREAIEAARKAAEDLQAANTAGTPRPGGRGAAAATGLAASAAAAEGGGLREVVMAPVGETLVTDGVLTAREVDESTVQVSTMLDQVSAMVDADPGAVAALFERWIEKSE